MKDTYKDNSLTARSWDLFVTTLAQSLALGAMIVASAFIGAVIGTAVGVRQARAENGRNLVMIPVYQAAEDAPKEAGNAKPVDPSNKVQYSAQDDELPIVHAKQAQAETKAGAELSADPEVVIDPDGGVAILSEPIVEKVETAPGDSEQAEDGSRQEGAPVSPSPALAE